MCLHLLLKTFYFLKIVTYFTNTQVIFFFSLQKHLSCMDSSEPSFGQDGSPRVLPITTAVDNSLTSQNIPGPLTQTQTLSAEQFHLVDQNGQPIQYELQSLGDSNEQMVSTFLK